MNSGGNLRGWIHLKSNIFINIDGCIPNAFEILAEWTKILNMNQKFSKIFRGGKFLKYHFELIHLSYSETETGANVAHGIGIHYLIISLLVIHPTWPAIWGESIWYRTHFHIWFIFFGWNWVNNRWSFANHSLKMVFKMTIWNSNFKSFKPWLSDLKLKAWSIILKTDLSVDTIVCIYRILDFFTTSENKIIVMIFIDGCIIAQKVLVDIQAHNICLAKNIKITIFNIVTSTQSSYWL